PAVAGRQLPCRAKRLVDLHSRGRLGASTAARRVNLSLDRGHSGRRQHSILDRVLATVPLIRPFPQRQTVGWTSSGLSHAAIARSARAEVRLRKRRAAAARVARTATVWRE